MAKNSLQTELSIIYLPGKKYSQIQWGPDLFLKELRIWRAVTLFSRPSLCFLKSDVEKKACKLIDWLFTLLGNETDFLKLLKQLMAQLFAAF